MLLRISESSSQTDSENSKARLSCVHIYVGRIRYKDWSGFDRDVMRIFENAHRYNPPAHWVCADAETLQTAYLEYLLRNTPWLSTIPWCLLRSSENPSQTDGDSES